METNADTSTLLLIVLCNVLFLLFIYFNKSLVPYELEELFHVLEDWANQSFKEINQLFISISTLKIANKLSDLIYLSNIAELCSLQRWEDVKELLQNQKQTFEFLNRIQSDKDPQVSMTRWFFT